jgi:hypothetical protein
MQLRPAKVKRQAQASWLNPVEAFFSIITRQALRRGNFPTVADLVAAIERFIAAWNYRCTPRSPGPRTPTPSSPRPPTLAAGRHKRRQLRSTKDHYRRTLRMLVTLGPACAMPTA